MLLVPPGAGLLGWEPPDEPVKKELDDPPNPAPLGDPKVPPDEELNSELAAPLNPGTPGPLNSRPGDLPKVEVPGPLNSGPGNPLNSIPDDPPNENPGDGSRPPKLDEPSGKTNEEDDAPPPLGLLMEAPPLRLPPEAVLGPPKFALPVNWKP